MKRRLTLALVCAGALASACRRSPAPSTTPTATAPSPPAAAPDSGRPTLKIWIAKPGTIEMNGRTVDLAEVSAALDDLAKHDGQVLFGQDFPDGMPHPNVPKVLKLIMDKGLDFRSAHDRSFSELAPDHHYDKSYLERD
jgi:hypothetical protein